MKTNDLVTLGITTLITAFVAFIFWFLQTSISNRKSRKLDAEKEAKNRELERRHLFLGPNGVAPKDVNEAVSIAKREGRNVKLPSIRGVNILLVIFGILAGGLSIWKVGQTIQVGYQPAVVPLKVSIDNSGNVVLEPSSGHMVPVGTFNVANDDEMNLLRDKYSDKILIVRVDNRAIVYELDDNKRFDVTFKNDNNLYDKVELKNENNGDIILNLELINSPKLTTPTSAPTQEKISFAEISCEGGILKVNLRRTPGYLNKDDSDLIAGINCGQLVELLGETQIVDGLTWWKVSWNGYIGWVADHTGSGLKILIFE